MNRPSRSPQLAAAAYYSGLHSVKVRVTVYNTIFLFFTSIFVYVIRFRYAPVSLGGSFMASPRCGPSSSAARFRRERRRREARSSVGFRSRRSVEETVTSFDTVDHARQTLFHTTSISSLITIINNNLPHRTNENIEFCFLLLLLFSTTDVFFLLTGDDIQHYTPTDIHKIHSEIVLLLLF